MKRFTIYPLICLSLLLSSMPDSYGQFFKKLKKTVKELVVTPPQDNGAANQADNANSATTEGQTHPIASMKKDPNKVLQDPKAHGIEQIAAITVDFRDQYVCMDYTDIALRQGQVVATVPIGHFEDKEALSEMGEGSAKDPVAIYANNTVARTTTIGALRKETDLLSAHKRFNYPWSKELVRSSSQQAELYVKKGEGPDGLFSSINFNGKKYGPYMIIGDLLVGKDSHRFFAQICPDMKAAKKGSYSLLGMDGKVRVLPTGGDIIANLDFTSSAVMIANATLKLSESMQTENEDEAAAKQQEGMQLAAAIPNKGNVYFLNGKTLVGVLLSGGWLDNSGQNFFATTTDENSGFEKGTYLNGKKIADQSIHTSRGWANARGTVWAIEVDNYSDAGQRQLIFSDGTQVYDAKDVHPLFIDGNYYMVWYNYNHQYSDQLKVYKKALL